MGAAATLAFALGLAACGSDGSLDDGLAAAGGTSAAATGPADTGTADTGPADTGTGGGAGETPSQLPEESNCAPGPGDLPDGLWFGYRTEALDEVLAFDLACWFSGDAAAEAAAAAGAESPPPNDYYLTNTNETVRYLSVASPEAPVDWLPGGGATTEEITYSQWVSERASGYIPPIWLVVEGGEVVRIAEQYLP